MHRSGISFMFHDLSRIDFIATKFAIYMDRYLPSRELLPVVVSNE